MSPTSRIAFALVLSAASTLSWSSPLDASIAALADDENGRSLDVSAAWQPTDWLALGAGLGSTSSRTPAGQLDGTSLTASGEVHSERIGLRGYYRSWNSNGLDTNTVGARALFRAEGLTLSAIGETRGLDVDYALAGSNPVRSSAHFSATGWGAGASYQWSHWSVNVEGMSYRYGPLSRHVANPASATNDASTGSWTRGVSTLPVLSTLPTNAGPLDSAFPAVTQSLINRAPALSGSYVTLGEGIFDHLLTAGVERRFARSSLRFDWNGVKDAVLDVDINSFSAGYRYLVSPRWNVGMTLGVTESRYGSVGFGGVSIGMTL